MINWKANLEHFLVWSAGLCDDIFGSESPRTRRAVYLRTQFCSTRKGVFQTASVLATSTGLVRGQSSKAALLKCASGMRDAKLRGEENLATSSLFVLRWGFAACTAFICRNSEIKIEKKNKARKKTESLLPCEDE